MPGRTHATVIAMHSHSSSPPAGEQAISVAALAERLGVSRSTVYLKANSGDIPGFKVGKVWRFYPSAVDAHLQRPTDPWAMSPASRRARRAS